MRIVLPYVSCVTYCDGPLRIFPSVSVEKSEALMSKNSTIIEASYNDIIDSRWRLALPVICLSTVISMICVGNLQHKMAAQTAPNPIAIDRQDGSKGTAGPARELSWEPVIFDELSDLIPIPIAPGRFAGIHAHDEAYPAIPHSLRGRIE